MAFIHNIRTVAHYEAKTLRRSWFFRLFAIGALLIFTMMNIGVFSPIGDEDWESMGIAAALPHINLYLLNIAQAIVVIFLAADFLKRDKKLDTNEVLYTRSMSNMEYVAGKTLGILRLFLGLNILILAIGLIINIISPVMKVDIAAYFTNLLLISVPTIVFSLGFSFLLMSLIRNQAITVLVLLGYAALVLFYLFFRAGYIFDYMAFGLPLFKSEVIGYDNAPYIIFHRLLYFSLGMASVMATILIFKRLPQSPGQNRIAQILLVVFLVTSGFSAYYVLGEYYRDINKREI
jgi:ABC-type transport system involved in multi-copper enzyme maturation permease subunit